jgi:hypothetical protein
VINQLILYQNNLTPLIMKKLIPLSAFAIILLFGCVKEETMFAVNENQLVEKSIDYVFNLDGDNLTWEQVIPDELSSTPGSSSSVSTRANNNNSVHMHGNFFGPVEFSATVNNGGTHGGATLNLGPFVFTTETQCILAEDNEAVYGGIITEVVGPPGPFQPGWRIYFKVIDNGEGNNAPADQFYGAIRFTPNQNSSCDDYDNWGPSYDVGEGQSIKINN